jgi:hypothetical protein
MQPPSPETQAGEPLPGQRQDFACRYETCRFLPRLIREILVVPTGFSARVPRQVFPLHYLLSLGLPTKIQVNQVNSEISKMSVTARFESAWQVTMSNEYGAGPAGGFSRRHGASDPPGSSVRPVSATGSRQFAQYTQQFTGSRTAAKTQAGVHVERLNSPWRRGHDGIDTSLTSIIIASIACLTEKLTLTLH